MSSPLVFDGNLCHLEQLLFGMTLKELITILDYDERTVRLFKLIEGRYHDPELDLHAAGLECGMSKNNVNDLLKKMTNGLTFGYFLAAYRVYRSTFIALGTNHTFTQIALMCGFSESSSYTRAVRRLLAVSPSVLLPRGANYRRVLRLPAVDRMIDPLYETNAS